MIASWDASNAAPLRSFKSRKHESELASLSLYWIRDFICEHYALPISVEELAARASLTRGQFVRAFRRVFGSSPAAYKMRLQVEHARTLIAQGVLPTTAASNAGFAGHDQFKRQFRKVHGMTPRQYQVFSRRRY